MQWHEYYQSRRVEPAKAAAMLKLAIARAVPSAAGGVMQRAGRASLRSTRTDRSAAQLTTVDPRWLDGSGDPLRTLTKRCGLALGDYRGRGDDPDRGWRTECADAAFRGLRPQA
jgi:hypothetical protein